jgi:hypothetical protein
MISWWGIVAALVFKFEIRIEVDEAFPNFPLSLCIRGRSGD